LSLHAFGIVIFYLIAPKYSGIPDLSTLYRFKKLGIEIISELDELIEILTYMCVKESVRW